MIPAGMFRNIGKEIFAGAGRFLGTAAGRTAMGAAAGGLYGAFSDNTSVLGGALMGAAAGRYLGTGIRNAMRFRGAGLDFGAHAWGMGKSFMFGTVARARLDWKGARIMANKGASRIASTLKGWW